MKRLLSAIGPAIIIAAVVLGPGSILTSSKVGASQGLAGIPTICVACILMMGMVILSTRLGAVCEHSLCTEIALRLGRPAAVTIGIVFFLLVAIFQSSNNIAVIGGLEPLLGDEELGLSSRIVLLAGFNLMLITCLYLLRDLYSSIERLMKVLIAVMGLAFITNLAFVLWRNRGYEAVVPNSDIDWLAITGMIGTTFSVGGAFYQAYLVREKGWGIDDVRHGTIDSVVSISILGGITCVVLLTSWRVFYGNPGQPVFGSVRDVAIILEPSLGAQSRILFACGILAGAMSSFLGNALIGGTVLSDSLGKGARLEDKWPLHFTTTALLTGMAAAIAALGEKESIVPLITFAQALTVLGLPAIAAALVYLGTRPDLRARAHFPRWLLGLTTIGLIVSCGLAALTTNLVWSKLTTVTEVSEAGLN